ncbi:MAG: hypothetical protein ACK4TA_25465 [Saprospiraceae bacterium]
MKLLLLLCQLLSGLTLIPWAVMSMFSPMLFDAPDSTKQTVPYVILAILFTYPIFVIICIVLGWRFWSQQHVQWAFFISLLPAIIFGIGFLFLFRR